MLNCFNPKRSRSNTRGSQMPVTKLNRRENSFESDRFRRRWMLKVRTTSETTIPHHALWKRCLKCLSLPQTSRAGKSTSSESRTRKSTQLKSVFPIRTKRIIYWKLGSRGSKNFKAFIAITRLKWLRWWGKRWEATRNQTFLEKTSRKIYRWSNNQGQSI